MSSLIEIEDLRVLFHGDDGRLGVDGSDAFGRCLATDEAREVVGKQCVILPPARPIPTKPFSPRRDETKVACVAIAKAQRERVVTE